MLAPTRKNTVAVMMARKRVRRMPLANANSVAAENWRRSVGSCV